MRAGWIIREMDEDVDKDAIGHELAACIAEAQALRTMREAA